MLKTRQDALVIAKEWDLETSPVIMFGYRSAKSQYGQYDDILALLTPDDYREYKGNTLPSKKADGIAVLQPGPYRYAQGLHGVSHLEGLADAEAIRNWLEAHRGQDYPNPKGRLLPYWAFRQAGPVKIKRIGSDTFEIAQDPGKWPWIDLHKGGYNLTSSLGCQTFYPDHWEEVRRLGFAAMGKAKLVTMPYILHQEAA